MDHLFDLQICLSTIFVFFVGQTVHSIIANKNRTRLALLQREEYFSKLSQDFKKMDQEVDQKWNKLKDERDKLVAELKQFGISGDIGPDDIQDEEDLKRTKANLENIHRQLEECDNDIREISGTVGFDDDVSLDNLKQRIKQLENENRNLQDQTKNLSSATQPPCAIVEHESDPELLEFLEAHDYTTDTLNKVYEVLLELEAQNRDKDLEDYLSSLEQSRYNYGSELTELDVKRKKMELRLDQTRRVYEEELASFNESRIEYLFRITGARELLAQLKEKNDIAERIVNNRRREFELKKNDPSRSRDEFQSNYDL